MLLARSPCHRWRRHSAVIGWSHRLKRLALALCCLLLAACSKMIDMQSGLNDADANEIIMVLTRHGIETQKRVTKEGVSVSVKDGDLSRATAALDAVGLPRRKVSTLGQVFKKEGMISTPLEERARYIHGLSDELELTLQKFDHVVSARVHVVLPERVAPGEPIQPASAAVFVKYFPPLDEDVIVPKIRSLIAGSIPGLGGDEGRAKVSVVLLPSEQTAPAVEWTTVGPFQVMAQSAGALTWTLVCLTLFGVLGSVGGIALLLLNHPRSRKWIEQRLPRKAAARKGARGADGKAGAGA